MFLGLGRRPVALKEHTKNTLVYKYSPPDLLSRRSIFIGRTRTIVTDAHPHSRPRQYARRAIVGVSAVFLATFGYLYITDTRAGVHRWIVVPALKTLYPDAEQAHDAGIATLKGLYRLGMSPRERGDEDGSGMLQVEVFGQTLRNPLAISAGLDKHAEIVSPLFALGPAIVEIGGVTPLPQEGNAKPRVWRVPSQRAMVNRYGLNSKGAAHVARQLRQRVREFAEAQGYGVDQEAERMVLDGYASVPPGSLSPGRLLAVQIAKNKSTPAHDDDAVKRDYVQCVEQLGSYADIIVVNVSSPNTPGLRRLQEKRALTNILTDVVQATTAIPRRTKPAVMVKVSPDEDSEEDIRGICEAVWQSGVDGVIVANTTRRRPPPPLQRLLPGPDAASLQEAGGYSGPGLFPSTLDLVKRYRHALDNSMPLEADHQEAAKTPKTIFASGGICNGDDVRQVRDAGASVAMVYSAMAYKGSGFITALKRQLCESLKRAPPPSVSVSSV